MKSRTDELGLKALDLFDEVKKCIKDANTKKDKQLVRELLNTIASQQSALEDYYKHPETIQDVPVSSK